MRGCAVYLAAALLATCLFSLPSASMAVPGWAKGCPFIASSMGQLPINDVDKSTGDEWAEPPFSAPSNCTAAQYDEIAQELIALGSQLGAFPKLLRLGFHTCGSWSAQGRNGGCNGGWVQWPVDYDNGANAGLKPTILAIKELKSKWPCITFADLATFAGAIAAEAAGGPPVAWYPGRLDSESPGPSAPAFSVRLPMGAFTAPGNFYYFVNLGLTMREGVALTGGGHSIGGATADATGWNGSFTSFGDAWPTPSNLYFVDLLKYGWDWEQVGPKNRLQWVPAPGQDINYEDSNGKRVFRLPADMAFRTTSIFSFWSVTYARNESAFINDFQRAMQRTLQLGAGYSWTIDESGYLWKGIQGDFEGFGPNIKPQLDTEDIPIGAGDDVFTYLDQIDDPLADPSKPYGPFVNGAA